MAKFADEDGIVGTRAAARAISAANAGLDKRVFQAMLNPLSDLDIAFLKAMAQDDGPTSTASLEGRLGLGHGTVQIYRCRLLDAGAVTSQRRGELTFVLPQLADYLRIGR